MSDWAGLAWLVVLLAFNGFFVASEFAVISARRSQIEPLAEWKQMVIGVAITTVAWLATALLSKPTDDETLFRFYRATRPGGRGWEAVRRRAEAAGQPLPSGAAELP